MVGDGWPPGAGPTAGLVAASGQLRGAAESAAGSWYAAEAGWTGVAADAAREFSGSNVASLESLGSRVKHLGVAAAQAAEAVVRARVRLHAIVEDFEARATAIDPDAPGAEQALMAEARRALDEAVAVVDELRAELDGRAVEVSEPAATMPVAAAAPASALPSLGGWGSPGGSSMGSGLGSGELFGGAAPTSAGSSGLGSGWDAAESARPVADEATFGSGVALALPDGSTATAPNAVAASAVRHALTQLGVPYDWGGTTPGLGLDCSGLTQWAYREAGLDLPRLAQEQDVGAAVNQGALRPGDLAVWDGHVAMIVGNGQMIEAGDPVKLSPIRTTNLDQGFQGFWRPTA